MLWPKKMMPVFYLLLWVSLYLCPLPNPSTLHIASSLPRGQVQLWLAEGSFTLLPEVWWSVVFWCTWAVTALVQGGAGYSACRSGFTLFWRLAFDIGLFQGQGAILLLDASTSPPCQGIVLPQHHHPITKSSIWPKAYLESQESAPKLD